MFVCLFVMSGKAEEPTKIIMILPPKIKVLDVSYFITFLYTYNLPVANDVKIDGGRGVILSETNSSTSEIY